MRRAGPATAGYALSEEGSSEGGASGAAWRSGTSPAADGTLGEASADASSSDES